MQIPNPCFHITAWESNSSAREICIYNTGCASLWPTPFQHAYVRKTRTIPPWLYAHKWKEIPENTDECAYAQPQARWNEETKHQESPHRIFHDNNKLMEFTSHLLFMLFDRLVGSLQYIGGKLWCADMKILADVEAKCESWWLIFAVDLIKIYKNEIFIC